MVARQETGTPGEIGSIRSAREMTEHEKTEVLPLPIAQGGSVRSISHSQWLS